MTIAGLVLLLGAAAATLFYVAVAGVTVSPQHVGWLAGGSPAPTEANVYRRYLERHRRHRLAGGLFGAMFAIVVGVRWFGSVSIGIGEGNPLADILFCALTGVLVGALFAERFRLSDPASATIAASLAAREALAGGELIRAARLTIGGSILMGVAIAVSSNGFIPLAVAMFGGAMVLVAEATRAAIRGRRRPVLSDRAQAVDLRIRTFAAGSVANLELAAAVLAAGWTLSKVPAIDNDVLLSVRFLVVIGCLVATIVLLRRAAPRPPRGWTQA